MIGIYVLLTLFVGIHMQLHVSENEIGWIESQLIKKSKDMIPKQIVHREITIAGDKNTSYSSEKLRIGFKGLFSGGGTYNSSVILIKLPSTPFRNKQIKQTGLFNNEIEFYEKVTPRLNDLMFGSHDTSDPLWPKMYGYKDDYSSIILQDIELDYRCKKADRIEGLDLNHSKLALATLGKYHAMTSVVSKDINLKKLFDLSLLQRNQKLIKNYYEVVFNNFAESIEQKWGPEWSDSAKKIREKSKTVTQEMLGLYERNDTGFNVLNHGSFSIYNIYFTYGSSDVYITPFPTSALFDNFQMAFYNSPAMDIQFFLNTSPQIDLIGKRSELIQIYYDSLTRYLKKFNYQGIIPAYDDILRDVEKLEFIGLTHAINHLNLIYLKSEEIPDLEKTIEKILQTKNIIVSNKGMYGEKYIQNMKIILKRAMDKNVI